MWVQSVEQGLSGFLKFHLMVLLFWILRINKNKSSTLARQEFW